jgi:hypothetical protein
MKARIQRKKKLDKFVIYVTVRITKIPILTFATGVKNIFV